MDTEDYRDDGREDKERQDRYRKAYDNHMEHKHTMISNVVEVDLPEFKMRMTPEEFDDQSEQWRVYIQVHPPPTPEVYFGMLRRSMTVRNRRQR